MIKQNVTRHVDVGETLQRYEARLRTFNKEDFSCFQGKYISTYRIYSVITENLTTDNPLYCDAFVVYKIAKEYGFEPLGVCSERMMKGQHVAKKEPCVYIGKYCYGAGLQSSKFRILPKDKVYLYSFPDS